MGQAEKHNPISESAMADRNLHKNICGYGDMPQPWRQKTAVTKSRSTAYSFQPVMHKHETIHKLLYY